MYVCIYIAHNCLSPSCDAAFAAKLGADAVVYTCMCVYIYIYIHIHICVIRICIAYVCTRAVFDRIHCTLHTMRAMWYTTATQHTS